MLSVENTTNQKRRSLTFADKFEVKFFFKAEAPREVAFSETSFTTGSESYINEDWDSDKEEYYEDYNDYDNSQKRYQSYVSQRGYHNYNTSEYNNYNCYDDDYYGNDVNYSIQYDMDQSNETCALVEFDGNQDKSSYRRELFSRFKDGDENNAKITSERANTRRLALAKLEKGLFRRQQQRNFESESEVSCYNSESDPFDESLPESSDEFFNELKRANSPVTIKATFTTGNIPITIQITNHDACNDSEDNLHPSSIVENESVESSKGNIKNLLKTTSLNNASSTLTTKGKSFDVKFVNNNDSVKTILNNSNNLLSNKNSSKKKSNINNLLSNKHCNSGNVGVNNKENKKGNNNKGNNNKGNNRRNNKGKNKGKKKKIISYTSPSIKKLLPCY